MWDIKEEEVAQVCSVQVVQLHVNADVSMQAMAMRSECKYN
jgi:hypothetical protein